MLNERSEMAGSSEIIFSAHDKDVLRKLGYRMAEISSDPINKVNAKNWTLLNDKKSVKPMVWANEIPWHEMNFNDELTLQCEDNFARAIEDGLRKTIYQWDHFRGDMVVSPFISCQKVFESTGFGITEEVDIAKTDENSDVVSRHFHLQITEPEDIEKIKMPKVTYYEDVTENRYNAMKDVFDGIIPVQKTGRGHIWYTPWDNLIRWWGVQEAMMDLVMRPDMVHAIYEKMVQAYLCELDQFEKLNLLSLDCSNIRVGSGGYGYVSDLPGENYNPEHVTPKNMWGCANAQIFSSVSPEMHWEFAIEHDLKWLERFGITYYGCCEPLDNKIDILRRIPNLRKLSVSPWNDNKKIIDAVGGDYVLSRKPNPAIVAWDTFSPETAEQELRDFMDLTDSSSHVEIIMKDISTVRYQPQRLWEWVNIASRVAEDYAK